MLLLLLLLKHFCLRRRQRDKQINRNAANAAKRLTEQIMLLRKDLKACSTFMA